MQSADSALVATVDVTTRIQKVTKLAPDLGSPPKVTTPRIYSSDNSDTQADIQHTPPFESMRTTIKGAPMSQKEMTVAVGVIPTPGERSLGNTVPHRGSRMGGTATPAVLPEHENTTTTAIPCRDHTYHHATRPTPSHSF